MNLQQMENKNRITDSDVTMRAENNFQAILEQIYNSKLNYQLQLSPFSAVISLKKSFIKNRDGSLILPSSFFELDSKTEDKNNALEEELKSLQTTYTATVRDYE